MNTLSYLQFFDGLAEKKAGTFAMERVSSKRCDMDLEGEMPTYSCRFLFEDGSYHSKGESRKEALRRLYRMLRKFDKKG